MCVCARITYPRNEGALCFFLPLVMSVQIRTVYVRRANEFLVFEYRVAEFALARIINIMKFFSDTSNIIRIRSLINIILLELCLVLCYNVQRQKFGAYLEL